MDDNIRTTWTDQLSEEQRERLRWLRSAKCTVEVFPAPADPLHSLPEGLVIEVIVDKHAVVKLRATLEEIPLAFDQAYQAAQNLFRYVNKPDDLRDVLPMDDTDE